MGLSSVLPSLIARITGFFFIETYVRLSGGLSASLAASEGSATISSTSNHSSRDTDDIHTTDSSYNAGNTTTSMASSASQPTSPSSPLSSSSPQTHPSALSSKQLATGLTTETSEAGGDTSAFSTSDLSALWDKNIGFMYTIATRNSDNFRTPEQLLQVKRHLFNFVELCRFMYIYIYM